MKNFINILDRKFSQLHKKSCEIIKKTPESELFYKLDETYMIFSVGEFVLRSAGKVEQSFGGITARLWDDPFEWTLPEELSTNEKILEYLSEVEQTRMKGFETFQSDEMLNKELPAPEELKSLFEILIETLTAAENIQGRATVVLQLIIEKNK